MLQLVDAVRVAELGPVALAECLSLLLLPFASEDLAFVFGGYMVVNRSMPAGLAAISIYVGIVASDFALYGIGAAARRVPWLSRVALDDQLGSFNDTFERNMFAVVALCRLVPGLFIALIACGWTRVPFARFAMASLLVSALYLPLMLYLMVASGDALDDHVGLWTWPFLVGVVALAGLVRNRVFAFDPSPLSGAAEPEPSAILSRTQALPRPVLMPLTHRMRKTMERF